jgi:hypothetical protein
LPTLRSQAYLLVAQKPSHSQFLQKVSAEPNLFELCRTEQKSAKLKPAKKLAYPVARQTEKQHQVDKKTDIKINTRR